MTKSADAFRTISEVADWLDTPAHVLRFWESKFTQIKPIKRAGGRRYYRPADMELLGGIKRLLHEEGLTIKGVQKLLRDKGVGHVAAMSQPLGDLSVVLEAEVVSLRTTPAGDPAAPPGEASPVPAMAEDADPGQATGAVAGTDLPESPALDLSMIPADPAEDSVVPDPGILMRIATRQTPLPRDIAIAAHTLARKLARLS